MTQPDKLLNCPFCDWSHVSLCDAGLDRHQVKCHACGSSGAICKSSNAATNQWNMRQGLPYKQSDDALQQATKLAEGKLTALKSVTIDKLHQPKTSGNLSE